MEPFKKIQPQLSDVATGPEPALFDIVKYYYTSHGIDNTKATKLTEDYFKTWLGLYYNF